MTMITPSAQLTLTKGNKSWSSTAVAAALELVDPLGLWTLAVTHCGRFFFFFFFFFCHAIVATANIKIPRVLLVVVTRLPATIPHPSTIRLPLAVLEIVLAIQL
eukprot:FR735380.1.p1 GENE.FR735380.1~~FR735380.1.p1  ORF type:complete len:104 (-),score=34.38 FR735380.1:222-533(-)